MITYQMFNTPPTDLTYKLYNRPFSNIIIINYYYYYYYCYSFLIIKERKSKTAVQNHHGFIIILFFNSQNAENSYSEIWNMKPWWNILWYWITEGNYAWKILVKEFSLVILKEFKEEDAFLEQFAEDNHLLDVQQTFEN